jgi:hypothetical protein
LKYGSSGLPDTHPALNSGSAPGKGGGEVSYPFTVCHRDMTAEAWPTSTNGWITLRKANASSDHSTHPRRTGAHPRTGSRQETLVGANVELIGFQTSHFPQAITTEGRVIDVFTAAGLPKPDISILSIRRIAAARPERGFHAVLGAQCRSGESPERITCISA